MPSPRHPSSLRRRWGRLLGSVAALGLVAPLLAAPPAMADEAVAPDGGSFTITGAGYGHGHGMSQYGAYGAARKGLSWKQILTFYYPGTERDTLSARSKIRVWLTADTDGDLRVSPATGLRVTDDSGHSLTLPTGSAYRSWRITRSGSGYRLAHRTASGSWRTTATPLDTTTWRFSNPRSKAVTVVLPSGSTRAYRGSVALVKRGTGARSVNRVHLENYLRSVVPSEMPTSWARDAVRAQAVAARSYAVRLRDFYNYDGYDVCDTTACQVYRGTVGENSGGDAAVLATAGVIVTYQGKVALTQFASSNGGAAARSNLPYLAAFDDPYDGVVTSQAWKRTITAASIAGRWPAVGTVRKLQVTQRDGSGRYGGRVVTIKIIGSRDTVSVGGSTFQYRFGMRSSLYRVS